MNEAYGFYSSLDADSLDSDGKLEEGAFYVWKENQLKKLLKENYDIFKDYFNINSYGHWEHGNYVLIRDAENEEIAKKHNISTEVLEKIISSSKVVLFEERNKRSRPRLDDKVLTSWNGLMLKGLTDAYRYLENESYLELALKNAGFILENLKRPDGGLFHNHKNGKSTINGYLEDYAAIIDAFIGLYEITFDEKWLSEAKDLTDYSRTNFFDLESKMFFFSSKKDNFIIRRTIEVGDNVVPSSNSIMGMNLFKLSKYFPQEDYREIALQMLKNVQENFDKNAQNHANWLNLNLMMRKPFYEIAIVGNEYLYKGREIRRTYLPNTIISGTAKESSLSILQNRYIENETLIHICQNNLCKLPTKKTKEALKQISEHN